ncbi:MAG TPA: antibiotic biosynthesis monooxygenase family protein [Pyrinomonadaceae bacterium]
MIVKTTKITARPDKRMELSQTIAGLLGPVRNVKGCRTFRFYLDSADENSSLLLSEWDTESDLNQYLRSNDFAVLKGALAVLSSRSTDSKALVTSETSDADN